MNCADKNNKRPLDELISEWVGKKIVFPNENDLQNIGNMYRLVDYFKKQYKILVYVDSVGCVECKLQLIKWENFIHEIDSILPGKVSILFVVNIKESRRLEYLLKYSNINIPFVWDKKDELNRLNNFSNNPILHTFLLDRNNEVILVGNPIINNKLKNLYFNILLNKRIENKIIPKTNMHIENNVVEIGDVEPNKLISIQYDIKNNGPNPLIVGDIQTSCGCVVVDYLKKPIKPEEIMPIKIGIKINNEGYFMKEILIYSNAIKSPVKLKLKGRCL